MGVYIKGMEMPKKRETITITICDDGIVFEEWKEPGSVFKAIPVQPHGRLIDADALEALFWDGQCYFTENIKYKIKNIETIFPAEEGET